MIKWAVTSTGDRWADRFIRWSLAFAAVGVLLVAAPTMSSHFALPKLLCLSLGLLGAWTALAFRSAGPKATPSTPLDKPLLLALAAFVLCAVFSEDPLVSLLGNHHMYAYG
ncbi:hypothetical protein ACFL2T_06120, partial [Elusimicrobiota bacterium]